MESTRFTELFDNTSTVRVLDVMICGREYDYALTDMSRSTGLNRQRLRGIIKKLTERQIIYPTRKLSGMQMHRLNAPNAVAVALIETYDQVSKLHAKPKVKG